MQKVKLLPIYTSRGDVGAFLYFPYILNLQGEWIGWVSDDKKVFSFVLSTGALAGYKKCFMEGFEKEVAPFHPPYAIPRFCILVGMKRF